MSKTLVIVESPGKVKKLGAILGEAFEVRASVGHVRDLPERETGVAAPDFKPQYIPTERGKEVLAKLRKAVADANSTLLATDPDREGEAIAWHLADALGLKNAKRITFNEITPGAVKAAVQKPRGLDMGLVHAQEARRVLDRLVGYTVSPVLSDGVGERLSAGRVQTPAVRLVVDRERAIKAFKPTTHYGAELQFTTGAATWRASWDVKPWRAEGAEYFTDKAVAERVSALRAVTVSEFENSEAREAPPAPFTTSSMQQVAGRVLKMKPKATMDLAQRLYEQGVITYHRTDNPNLSDDGAAAIAEYARKGGLPLAEMRRSWKAKEGAQEAHEAIRPTHIDQLVGGETEDEKRLYALIWKRAVASQLADAVYAVRTVTLDAVERIDGKTVAFVAKGRTLQSGGWKAVYQDDEQGEEADTADEDAEGGPTNPVPALALQAGLTAHSGRLLSKTTKPPKRYKLATLVKKLEELGIGRPSTYAAILENITAREYVVEDKKDYLLPGPAGEKIVDALVGVCGFVELDYTRDLEQDLDKIAEGAAQYQPVVADAYKRLSDELGALQAKAGPKHDCPACGKPLRRRPGKKGYWWGCTGYPECEHTFPDVDGKPGERRAPAAPTTQHKCTECGKPLARRTKAGVNGWDFWSCTGYPKCKKTYRVTPEGVPKFDNQA